MAQEEAECAAALENPPWYPTLIPAEHHDSERRVSFRVPSSPGLIQFQMTSMLTHHRIRTTLRSAWQHVALTRCTFMVEQPADATPPSSQTYVASVELGSLDEIWRTYLNNANITNEFYLQGAVYAFADGSLGATALINYSSSMPQLEPLRP